MSRPGSKLIQLRNSDIKYRKICKKNALKVLFCEKKPIKALFEKKPKTYFFLQYETYSYFLVWFLKCIEVVVQLMEIGC